MSFENDDYEINPANDTENDEGSYYPEEKTILVLSCFNTVLLTEKNTFCGRTGRKRDVPSMYT